MYRILKPRVLGIYARGPVVKFFENLKYSQVNGAEVSQLVLPMFGEPSFVHYPFCNVKQRFKARFKFILNPAYLKIQRVANCGDALVGS